MKREKIDLLSEFNCSFRIENERIVWVGDNPPTQKQIDDKIADYDAKKYQRDRASSYPPLAEQFDLLFKDINSGKVNKDGGFYKAIKGVKNDFPKPE